METETNPNYIEVSCCFVFNSNSDKRLTLIDTIIGTIMIDIDTIAPFTHTR